MKKLLILFFAVPFFALSQSIPHRADLHQSDDWKSLLLNDNSSTDATTGWVNAVTAQLPVYPNIAKMTRSVFMDSSIITVGGYYNRNDGGGGQFVYHANGSFTEDSVIYFASRVGGGYFQKVIVNNTISVKEGGARGNRYDDLVAFQRVFNAGIVNITIPKDVYKLKNSVTVNSNTTVDGGNSELVVDSTVFTGTNTQYGFFKVNNVSNVTIKNTNFNGSGMPHYTPIGFDGSTHSLNSAILGYSVQNVSILNCNFYGNGQDNFGLFRGVEFDSNMPKSNNISIDKCLFRNIDDAIVIFDASNVNVTNSRTVGGTSESIIVNGTLGYPSTNVYINNNVVDSNIYAVGISMQGCQKGQALGNHINKGWGGIRMDRDPTYGNLNGCLNLNINNNYIDAAHWGIVGLQGNTTVDHNTIINCDTYVIKTDILSSTGFLNITNNYLNNPLANSVSFKGNIIIDSIDNVIISGNDLNGGDVDWGFCNNVQIKNNRNIGRLWPVGKNGGNGGHDYRYKNGEISGNGIGQIYLFNPANYSTAQTSLIIKNNTSPGGVGGTAPSNNGFIDLYTSAQVGEILKMSTDSINSLSPYPDLSTVTLTCGSGNKMIIYQGGNITMNNPITITDSTSVTLQYINYKGKWIVLNDKPDSLKIQALHIVGSTILQDGTQGVNKSLVSDANGKSSWLLQTIDNISANGATTTNTLTLGKIVHPYGFYLDHISDGTDTLLRSHRSDGSIISSINTDGVGRFLVNGRWKFNNIAINSTADTLLGIDNATGNTVKIKNTISAPPINFEYAANGQSSTGTYSYTVPSTGDYHWWVGGDLKIKSGTGSITYTVTYTDIDNSGTTTYTFLDHVSNGSSITGVGTNNFSPIHLSVKSGTTITVTATVTGTVNYYWSAYGEQKSTVLE